MVSPLNPVPQNGENENHHVVAAVAARPVQTDRGRCWECKKRVGLLGIDCRCGYLFCASHRQAEKHQCDFDYKAMHLQELKKNNPRITAKKIDKI